MSRAEDVIGCGLFGVARHAGESGVALVFFAGPLGDGLF